MKTKFKDAPVETVVDVDVLDGFKQDVSGMVGAPEGLWRPRDLCDLQEALRWASERRIPVLPVGAQTSTTGASVAMKGVILDCGGLAFSPIYDQNTGLVRVCPTQNMGELQVWLAQMGRELPPDPTSAPDCTMGGAVATNASGASSFRYGAMGNFVQGLSFVDGTGTFRSLNRRFVEKCSQGPVGVQDPVDWIVGSEGLFGVITQIDLRTQVSASHRVAVFAGLPDFASTIGAVQALREVRDIEGIRAIEWLDQACCALLSEKEQRIRLPEGDGGALYIELESDQEGLIWDATERVSALLTRFGVSENATQVMQGRSELAVFGKLRHSVPDTMNRRGFEARAQAGGGKLSTDWSVPLEKLEDLYVWTRDRVRNLGLDGFYAYGHIGNGHPHMNLLCPEESVKDRAYEVLKDQLTKVLAAGGVATSEHGIGKVKRDLVRPFLDDSFGAVIRALKAHYDPASILAPGNIISLENVRG